MAPLKKRYPRSKARPATSSNPYKTTIRIPRQVENSATLWLDFFQQFCDTILNREDATPNDDDQAIARARLLADKALETFQARFPGVYPE